MREPLNKFAIGQRFHQAAPQYDALAHLQRAAAMQLALRLPHALDVFAPWLDAGCGTGQARPLLMPPHNLPLIGLDIAHGMARLAQPHTDSIIQGDIEHLPLAQGSIALYWSNLAWQWCRLPRALSEAHRVLAPGGYLRVATLGPGTLAELRAAFDGLDDAKHVIDFEPPEAILQAAAQAGLRDIHLTRQTLSAWYPDLATIFRVLKGLGAAEVGPGRRRGLMGVRVWRELEARYEQHRTAEGLPVRYDVIFIEARRAP